MTHPPNIINILSNIINCNYKKTSIKKVNKNSFNIEEELEHKLDRQIQKMRRCYKHTGPSLKNKLLRLLNFPTQYLKDLLIRKSYFSTFLPKKN